MNTITFSIDESTGDYRYLVSDIAPNISLGVSTIKRASHVEPYEICYRVLFTVIRFLVSDDSKLAEWTRSWQCQWRVNLSPVGGPKFGPYYKRKTAIAMEVAWLNENFL